MSRFSSEVVGNSHEVSFVTIVSVPSRHDDGERPEINRAIYASISSTVKVESEEFLPKD